MFAHFTPKGGSTDAENFCCLIASVVADGEGVEDAFAFAGVCRQGGKVGVR